MAYCPSCNAHVTIDAKACAGCGADFTAADGWRPIESKENPPSGASAAGTLLKLGLAAVVLPAIGFLLGLLAAHLVPGCHCDEGAGCSGCGANGLITTLLFGGLAGLYGALIFVLPACLLLAGIIAVFSRRGA